MLLTRRLERMRAKPLGFVATDYALSIWGKGDMGEMIGDGRLSLDELFDEDMLGDDLEAWMADSWLLKRTFRQCAVIAGLVTKNHPGREKTGRQMTVSSDLVYDVLRQHEPDHILLRATWADAATGLLDVKRVSDLLARIKRHILHRDLEEISPLAVPIMLEAGRERVDGEARDDVLQEAMEQDLIIRALGEASRYRSNYVT
jgi:ATP-dependent Lhr-like helicase